MTPAPVASTSFAPVVSTSAPTRGKGKGGSGPKMMGKGGKAGMPKGSIKEKKEKKEKKETSPDKVAKLEKESKKRTRGRLI